MVLCYVIDFVRCWLIKKKINIQHYQNNILIAPYVTYYLHNI